MALPPNGSSIPVAQVPASIALPQIPSLDNTFGALAVGTYVGLVWVSRSCLISEQHSPIFVACMVCVCIKHIATSVYIRTILRG